MSSQAGQSLATFLLSVPVAAIGLMAVFGIPQFAAVIASPRNSPEMDPRHELDPFRQSSADLPGGYDPAFPPRHSQTEGRNTLDAPRWGNGPESSSGQFAQSNLNDQRPANLWREAMPGDRPSSTREQDQNPRASLDPWGRPQQAETSTLTWQAAVERLNELGVDEFHLESGSRPDRFMFVCLFTPGNQPDVAFRFEAEAIDPLVAVEDVVGQIENWLADRFATSSATSRSGMAPMRQDHRW